MAYNRHGHYVPDPAWRQTEKPDIDPHDWEEFEEEEPPLPEFDHDRRFMDKYDQDNGDIGDDGDPPF